MAINEAIKVPLESLADLALTNAQDAASDAQIIKQEYRVVNGKKVMFMQINGTAQNIKFSYLGYYYSDDSGTSQFVVFTGQNLVNKYKEEILNLLNGFTTF